MLLPEFCVAKSTFPVWNSTSCHFFLNQVKAEFSQKRRKREKQRRFQTTLEETINRLMNPAASASVHHESQLSDWMAKTDSRLCTIEKALTQQLVMMEKLMGLQHAPRSSGTSAASMTVGRQASSEERTAAASAAAAAASAAASRRNVEGRLWRSRVETHQDQDDNSAATTQLGTPVSPPCQNLLRSRSFSLPADAGGQQCFPVGFGLGHARSVEPLPPRRSAEVSKSISFVLGQSDEMEHRREKQERAEAAATSIAKAQWGRPAVPQLPIANMLIRHTEIVSMVGNHRGSKSGVAPEPPASPTASPRFRRPRPWLKTANGQMCV